MQSKYTDESKREGVMVMIRYKLEAWRLRVDDWLKLMKFLLVYLFDSELCNFHLIVLTLAKSKN